MTPEVRDRIDQIRQGIVPEGYKKTKSGILPESWSVRTIAECLERVEHPVEVQANEMYTQIGIRSHGKGLFYKEPVTGDSLGNKSVFWIEPDCFILNIVFAWEQAVGKTTQAEAGMIGSHRFPMYRPINGSIDIDYLISYLLTKRGTDILEAASPGGAGRNRTLGQDRFMKSRIVLPPLDEQKKIAEILSTQDKAVELQARKIEELKRFKKGCLEKMFPRKGQKVPEKRFPGFTDDWEQRKFDEVFDCTVPNNTLSRAELSYDEGTVLNVHYGDVLIKYGSVLDVQKDDIPRIPHRCREDFNGALLQDGDVIIADTAEDETTGKACEIGNLQGSAIVSGLHTMVCRPRNRMALGYLGYYLNSNAYHHQLLPLMQGIKVLSLSRSNIQKTSVSYPIAVKEQQLIAYYFSQLDNLITLHQRKLEEMKKQKKALMQLLLTGIVRVQS